MAVSTASAPLFMSNAWSNPVRVQSFSSSGGRRSLRKAREVRHSRRHCSTMAAAMRVWLCPWATAP